jgi:arylsulfatase A-like enzyme
MRHCLQVAVIALLSCAPGTRADSRPNILILLTDDQRADTVAALGHRALRTPNLDRLVREGFAFRNAYCMGSTVPAVCLPSRTMLISGLSLFRIGSWKPGSPSLPATFRAAGYETYHHGKRGNVPHQIHEAFEHNHYLEFTAGTYDETDRTSGRPGEPIADRAIEFLRMRDRDRPFLMYLAFSGPHDPRVVQPEFRQPYARADLPLPANFMPFHPFDNGDLLVRDEKLAPWPRTPQNLRD